MSWLHLETSCQRGSALAELLVLSIAMIPLMFMVPMLGKLMDLRHTAISASRYVAWEDAMGPAANSRSRSTELVGRRFFSSPESVISTQTAGVAGNRLDAVEGGVNPLWGSTTASRHTNESAQSFWRVFNFQDSVQNNPQSLASTVSNHALGGVAGTVSDSINTMASVLDFADGVRWDLRAGDYTAGTIDIEADVGNLLFPAGGRCGASPGTGDTPDVSDESTICFTESTAILSDTWGVPDSENVEDSIEAHTRSFVPGVVLQPLGRFLSVLGNLPIVEELEDLQHAFGYVDASQLPVGRSLGTYPE